MLGMWSYKMTGHIAFLRNLRVSHEVLPHWPLPPCLCRCPGCLWRFATSPCTLPQTLDWALPDSGKSQNQENGNTGKTHWVWNKEPTIVTGGWCLIKYSASVTAVWKTLLIPVTEIWWILIAPCILQKLNTATLPNNSGGCAESTSSCLWNSSFFYVAQTLGWWRENEEVSRSGYNCRGPCGWLMVLEALSVPYTLVGINWPFWGRSFITGKWEIKSCQ